MGLSRGNSIDNRFHFCYSDKEDFIRPQKKDLSGATEWVYRSQKNKLQQWLQIPALLKTGRS
ncbi:hypothetical protein KTH_40030 [Thermosporothrix hazakensis]|nr:hypothetical protein KTH_40030 [Thermosporothrix hazakensis]